MLDQASELRKLVRTRNEKQREHSEEEEQQTVPGSLARVISITSGKGGVGKTNLAVNLSIQLAKQGKQVVLFDMDLGLANVDILLDINPRYNLTHMVREDISVQEGLVSAPGGILVLPGASGVDELRSLTMKTRKLLLQALVEVQRMADVVVVDTGAGISNNVIPFAACADEVITVTTPEPTAMVDAYAAIKTLAGYPDCGELRILVNMAQNREEALETAEGVEQVASRFLNVYVEKLGFVLRDEHVSKAVRQKRPFSLIYPESPAARCVETLSGILTGRTDSKKNQRSSFIQRCVEWLMPT